MAKKTIHKVFGHTVLYLVIILGIFALQFRNQSIISRNFGQLRLTLSEIKNDTGEKAFKDSFLISYKGISLFSNTDTPLIVTDAKNNEKVLMFTGWQELSDSTFELYFSDAFVLICGLTGTNKDIFTISAPQELQYKTVSIPFQFSEAYSLMDLSQKRAILGGKTQQTILTAPLITQDRLIVTSLEKTITYANYEPSKEFLFESSSSYQLAQKSYYDTAVQTVKNNLVSQFSTDTESLTEQVIVSYISEMAARNKYTEAVSSIPASFVNGTRRTYLSAPFLNNLVAMSKSLKMQQENLAYKLTYSLEKQSLDIFKASSLDYFLLTQKTSTIRNLLAMPGKLAAFEPTVEEAAGIIALYAGLLQKKVAYSSDLKPYIDTCLKVIRKACKTENDLLYLYEKDEKISPLLSIHIGQALIDFASFTSQTDILSTAYLLFNTQVQNLAQFDIRSIAEIYTVIEKNNTYYPHVEQLSVTQENPLWAWTSARSISTSTDAEGTITIQTSFPEGYTHYMILNNVEPFKSIEIYDMMFRTDPRFESYNSSGYVYDAESKTLFLKYRHKKNTEIVRLFYKEQEPSTVETTPGIQTQEESNEGTTQPASDSEGNLQTSSEQALNAQYQALQLLTSQ